MQDDLPGRWGEDIKKSAGHGPGQLVQGGPTCTEVQTRSFPEVSLNLTILWFCKIQANLDISELKISRSSQWSEHICVYLTLETSKSWTWNHLRAPCVCLSMHQPASNVLSKSPNHQPQAQTSCVPQALSQEFTTLSRLYWWQVNRRIPL